ncbi:MAG: hypothetical protein KDJ33_19990 [Gammaproteobacteria bacterium]|nr:hypothetical protein [Gammaproteobacteria bacterium]
MTHRDLFEPRPLATSIRRCLCAAALSGTQMLATAYAGDQIVRSTTATVFGLPADGTRLAAPAVTTIDGIKHLQLLRRTDDSCVAQSLLYGPLPLLLDRTWLLQAKEVKLIRLPPPWCSDGQYYGPWTLVDIDGDGILELNIGNRLYTLDEAPVLLDEGLFRGGYNPITDDDKSRYFHDVDDDGDLDAFLVDFKGPLYKGAEYYENVGSPEAPALLLSNTEPEVLIQRMFDNLPETAREAAGIFTPYWKLIARRMVFEDVDGDGDTDFFNAGSLGTLPLDPNYYENIGTDAEPRYALPFHPFPVNIPYMRWVTDFDSDGDLDVLADVVGRPDLVAFYEKQDGRPSLYADPVMIGSTTEASWQSNIDIPGWFYRAQLEPRRLADLDGEGFQEWIVRMEPRYDLPEPLRPPPYMLFTVRDGAWEPIDLIWKTDTLNEEDFSDLTEPLFSDVDGDGDLDIVFSAQTTSAYLNSVMMEQVAPLSFAAPVRLPGYVFPPPGESFVFDLEDDGDLETFTDGRVGINVKRQPGNIGSFSVRSYVGQDVRKQVGGFVIEGDSPQTVILRGLGPSLAQAGIEAPLQDPVLRLYAGRELIAINDNWQHHPEADRIASAGLAPADARESALRIRLEPGTYTVHLDGKPGDTGIGITAIDNDLQMPSTAMQVSISGRALVGTGERIAIGGFIVEGDTPVRVLIRGLGPSLGDAGVSIPLADPLLKLHAHSRVIAINDDWRSAPNADEIAALADPPLDDKEAAILAVLNPGTYTVFLRGADGGTGVGIVAIDRP